MSSHWKVEVHIKLPGEEDGEEVALEGLRRSILAAAEYHKLDIEVAGPQQT
ncbi:hypothetical protein [Streptomyces sp. NPDC017448]|uniref:hypothetical protein n=1 Tax=Streptomyces sp. NPDC017448 TaxID=3364996 RepID=UPI0037BB008D